MSFELPSGVAWFVIVPVALTVGTLVGAVLFRTAVSVHNAALGGSESPDAVAPPPFVKALAIAFACTALNGACALAFLVALFARGGQPPDLFDLNLITVLLVTSSVNLLLSAGIVTYLLPATFGRGLLLTLTYQMCSMLLLSVVAGMIYVGSRLS